MAMNTSTLRRIDQQHLWHPYTRFSALQRADFPVIVRGKGVYLYDTDGNRYFDAISSWWCCNLGHGHPRLLSAMKRQIRTLQQSILGNLSHPQAVQLAAALADLMPGTLDRALFASDGASAVEAALKIALQYWHNIGRGEKKLICSLENAYHGDTLAAVAVGYIPRFHKPFEALMPRVLRAESPSCSSCRYGTDPSRCNLECFHSMETILNENADTLAAVIIEPLCQGAAGMRTYTPRYLQRLSQECQRRDILLIVDEIAMGFGRTGRMFAFEHAGITPDIVCLGKALTAGYLPMSATIVREEIYQSFRDTPNDHTFYHGHTFSGNPIAAATALAALDVYRREDIVGRSARTAALLAAEMESLRNIGLVSDIRCLGMIGAAELSEALSDEDISQITRRMWHAGILIRPLGRVLYFMPPLITPPAVLGRAVRTLKEILQTL